MKKRGFIKSSGEKAMRQGPIIKVGSGYGHSTIPRAGYGPGGRGSHTRYDVSNDMHSVDAKDPGNRGRMARKGN